MNKKMIIAFIVIAIGLGLTVYKTNARYKSNIQVNINDTTGTLKGDASVTGTGNTSEGYSYFDVTVRNYDANNNISEAYIKYNLEITNADNASVVGKYRWTDASNESNGVFEELTTTNDYYFGISNMESQVIRIEVKPPVFENTDIDYKVTVNFYQVSSSEGGA